MNKNIHLAKFVEIKVGQKLPSKQRYNGIKLLKKRKTKCCLRKMAFVRESKV